MIFGKFALISYLFAAALLGTGLVFTTAFDWDVFGGFSTTQAAVDTIISRHNESVNATSTNPNFIFGDYLAAAQSIGVILFNIPTGGLIADVFGSVGGDLFGPCGVTCGASGFAVADAVYALIRIFITFSSACLIINVISGRDI